MINNWHYGNEVELLINGEGFFPRVFASIRNAQHEILLETFILKEDKVGKALQLSLIAAAKRGVRVEVSVDDYGSGDLSEHFVADLVRAGVALHVFDPTPRLLGVRLNLFRRLHRKIVVVDSEVAFIGGINYSSDHLLSYGPEAKQDYAVQVRGPVISDIREVCLELLRSGSERKNKKFAPVTPTPDIKPVGTMRTLLSIRDNINHKTDIEQHYIRAIASAKRRLFIANAYFFPGYRILRAITKAAKRGVAVTLILQGQPDMPWVSACTRLLYGYLLRSGVVIHEYCQRPLHGKVALVDDEWSTVGSSNLDPLSLALNLEANLIIESAEFNQQLYEHLQSLAKAHCTPVNMKVAKLGYWWRLPFIFLSFHFLRIFPTMAGWLPVHSPKLKLLGTNAVIHSSAASNISTASVTTSRTAVKDKATIVPKIKIFGKNKKECDTEKMS
ncbi:MAG: cardiolipin synthase ClsB [Pseudomonadota bacterium]